MASSAIRGRAMRAQRLPEPGAPRGRRLLQLPASLARMIAPARTFDNQRTVLLPCWSAPAVRHAQPRRGQGSHRGSAVALSPGAPWPLGPAAVTIGRHLARIFVTVCRVGPLSRPCHTHCGLENSATYVGSGRARVLVCELLSCSLQAGLVLTAEDHRPNAL